MNRRRFVLTSLGGVVALAACSPATASLGFRSSDVTGLDVYTYRFARTPATVAFRRVVDPQEIATWVDMYTNMQTVPVTREPEEMLGRETVALRFDLKDGSKRELTIVDSAASVVLWPDGNVRQNRWGASEPWLPVWKCQQRRRHLRPGGEWPSGTPGVGFTTLSRRPV